MTAQTASPHPQGTNRWLALIGWLVACYLVAGISTLWSAAAIPTWYAALAKPPYNPPNQLFGPVWTLLYTLMAVAAWLVWQLPASPTRTRALGLFIVQLLLNFAWSWIFFHNHSLGLAFGEILLLWLVILLTMIAFFRLSRAAGWMLVPYLAWVSFASLLNWGILQRN